MMFSIPRKSFGGPLQFLVGRDPMRGGAANGAARAIRLSPPAAYCSP